MKALCILGNPGVTHYVTLHSSPLGQLAYVSSSSWIINEGIWLVISVFPWEILIYFYLAYSANNVIVLCLFCEYPIISFVAIQAWYWLLTKPFIGFSWVIFSNGRRTNESSAEESSAMLAAFWLAIGVFPGVMNIHRKRRFVSQLSQGWWMKCNVMDHTWVTEDGHYEDYNISFCKQWKLRCHCSYEQWHLNLHCLQRSQSCP